LGATRRTSAAAAAMDVDDGPSRDSLVRFEIAEP